MMEASSAAASFAAPNGHRSRGLAAGLGEIGIWRAKLVAIAHVARNSEAYRPNKMRRQGFPAIAEAIRGLNVERALIDGEAVVLRNDGRSDFGALLTKRGGAQASLVAFDLLRLEGDDQRLRPIEARREMLMRLVEGVDRILFSEALAAEGEVVFAKACELGLEGTYQSGRAASTRAGKAAIS